MMVEFTEFKLITQLNGSYVWDVKCSKCDKLISTHTEKLIINKNRVLENINQDPPVRLFCTKDCKEQWIRDAAISTPNESEIKEPPIIKSPRNGRPGRPKNPQKKIEGGFKCEICGKAFEKERSLKNHEGWHQRGENNSNSESKNKREKKSEKYEIFNFLRTAPKEFIAAMDAEKLKLIILSSRGD